MGGHSLSTSTPWQVGSVPPKTIILDRPPLAGKETLHIKWLRCAPVGGEGGRGLTGLRLWCDDRTLAGGGPLCWLFWFVGQVLTLAHRQTDRQEVRLTVCKQQSLRLHRYRVTTRKIFRCKQCYCVEISDQGRDPSPRLLACFFLNVLISFHCCKIHGHG